MEVGEFRPKPKPKAIWREPEIPQTQNERPNQLKSTVPTWSDIEEPWSRPSWYEAEERDKTRWEQELYQEELEWEWKEKLQYMEKQARLQEEIE